MNRVKTTALLAALTALFLWAGSALGGRGGLAISIVFAAAPNVGAYWFWTALCFECIGHKKWDPMTLGASAG
jgi:hypothetical protein